MSKCQQCQHSSVSSKGTPCRDCIYCGGQGNKFVAAAHEAWRTPFHEIVYPTQGPPKPVPGFSLEAVLDEIERELIAADGKYGPMPTILRGYKTIGCEYHELGAEVEGGERDTAAARKECVQLATMCFKLIRLIDGGATL